MAVADVAPAGGEERESVALQPDTSRSEAADAGGDDNGNAVVDGGRVCG